MKSREGYTRVPASWREGVPEEMGVGLMACGLCPDNKECNSVADCDAGTGLVWVPDHIYLVWRVNADPSAVAHRDWAVARHPIKEDASNS